MLWRGGFGALSLVLLVSAAVAEEKTKVDAKDWITLFNGKDFDGWVIDGPKEFKDKSDGDTTKPLWSVVDGMIRTEGKGFGFLRYDRQQFRDFRLHVEYRLVKKANSGIGIRTQVFDPKKSTETRPSFFSYEVQLLDDADKQPDKHCTASLYRYVAPKAMAHKPAPEWNTIEIECVGPKVIVEMNGKEVLSVDQTTIDEIKNKPLSGYVCLQSHSLRTEFKNIRIKEIKK